jgi:hypothetical protein
MLIFQQLHHILANAIFQLAGLGVVRYLIRARRFICAPATFRYLKAVGSAVASGLR